MTVFHAEFVRQVSVPSKVTYQVTVGHMKWVAKPYGSEEILRILLNPNIDPNKICQTRPLNIEHSTAYVVDLDCLEHPDDI